MELYACGFNAHGQLRHQKSDQQDIRVFEKIYEATEVRLLAAFWSSTFIGNDGTVHILGHPASGIVSGLDGHDIVAILNDDTLGPVILTKDGTIHGLEDWGPDGIHSKALTTLPLNIACLASAGNGIICACTCW